MGAALVRGGDAQLFVAMNDANPGLMRLATAHRRTESNAAEIIAFCKEQKIDFCVSGPEKPLADGITDALTAAGFPCASPSRAAAQIETSKIFMRQLLDRHRVDGQIKYIQTARAEEAIAFAESQNWRVAVKPVGLTGGKGVKVWGDHFSDPQHVRDDIAEILTQGISGHHQVVIEELLEGQEFTLHFYCDGKHAIPSPLIQDHKRAYDRDRGPNTGGMGAYSCENGLLPFVSQADYDAAAAIGPQVVRAMAAEGTPFHGVLYGQFMMTRSGPRIIEFNARFGDPEAINALSVLDSSYVDICRSMIEGTLRPDMFAFRPVATLLLYVVPPGYGTSPVADTPLIIDEAAIRRAGAVPYYASCNFQSETNGLVSITTTRSRTLGLFAEGVTLEAARTRVLDAVKTIKGHFAHRTDIGAPDVLAAKMAQMMHLRQRVA